MPFKRVLDTLEGLDEAHKVFYVQRGDKFFADVEDDTETDALRRAHQNSKQSEKDAKAALKVATDKLADVEEQLTATKSGKDGLDVLERSYKAKLDGKDALAAAEKLRLEKIIQRTLISSVSESLAADLFTVPKLAIKLIQDRFAVEIDGDTPVLRIRDAAGEVNPAMTLADLRKEYVDNKEYAGILKGNQASGGGAGGAGNGAGGAAPKPYQMNSAQRAEWQKRDPAAFERARVAGEFNPPKTASKQAF